MINVNVNFFHADCIQRSLHQIQNLKIRRRAVSAHGIKIALHKFAVSSRLRLFSTPHLRDMIPLERKIQFRFVLGSKARERHRKVKTHCNIAPAVVFKAEHLLFGLAVGFAQQDFGVFKHGRVYRHKAVGAVHLRDFFHQVGAVDFRSGKKVPEAF